MIEVNKFQTQLTDEYINSLKEECRTDLLDMINNVEFIQRLISPDRKYAKDLERDSSGKIKIDLVNPHIITDSNYFRQAAIHFQKHGCYTKLMPNPNPQSEYGQWLKREVMRCWNGMVRESDGEWVTGDMYFYLNYFPIIQTKIKNGSKVGERVIDFPEMWEGVYWRFHYWHQARYGGMYDDFVGGKHCIEIASRGRSKSYSFGSKLTKNFVLGENELNRRNVKSLVAAYQKEYLIKDGTLNKFIDGITHCAKYTQFPSARLKASMSDLNWKAGFIDTDTQLEAGTLNEVLGVAVKDDSDKLRGKRPHPYYCDVLTPNGYKKWGDIKVGDKIYGPDGKITNIIDIPFDGTDDIYKITLKDGRITYAGKDHEFNVVYWKKINGNQITIKETKKVSEILFDYKKETKTKKNSYKYSIEVNSKIDFESKNLLIDPYVMGLYLGDGCFDQSHCDRINITMLRDDIDDISKYIPYHITKSRYRDITHFISLLDDDDIFDNKYTNYSSSILQYYGLDKKTSKNKFIPNEYLYNSYDNRLKLLKGLLDTDGTCSTQGSIEYCSVSKELADNVMFLVRSLGMNSSCYIKYFHHEKYYRVRIFTKDNNIFNLKRKSDRVNINVTKYSKSFTDKMAITNIEYVGVDKCKCITVDNDSNSYLIDSFIETHNSSWLGFEEFAAFAKFLETWQTCMPNVQEGDISFGQMSGIGTGGSSGNDFMGALEMLNYPDGYRVYSLPNYWDKGAQGKKKTVFFYPGYVNSKGYYNEDGVSDVVGALISEIEYRINLKYNSSDPLQLTRRKAETAFTIQDAIMKRDGSLYPTDKLNDVINEINLNPKYTDDMWIGRLSLSNSGEVEYKPDNDLKYITEFPHKDNKIAGACCIFQMPIKNSSGSVPWGRYIAGCDPYDDDSSDTLSLMSMFILDLWTDEIVFEYTGRPMFAEDAYENIRLALLMYNCEMNYENNKKGLFNHFSKHNSLYLLSDTLEFLKDKDMAKPGLYGNKQKGTANYGNGEKAIAPYARRCIRDYLLKSQSTNVFKEIDGETIQETISIFNYQNIKSKALLQELAMWSVDGNYDRCDALAMLMLLREDKLRLLGDTSPRDAGANRDVGYLGKDAFFEKNYRKDISTGSKLKF